MTVPLDGSCPRILVVDDEREIGELIGVAAEGMGLSCTVLTSAMQLESEIDPAVAAVLVDLMMPEMDGIELVRLLAERQCRAVIILMSGHDRGVLRTAQDMARSLGLRTAGPLQKPFRIADIESLLAGLADHPVERAVLARSSREPLDELALRAALRRREVIVHYQPQIELATGRVAGVEALARLQHPLGGIAYPDQFIALAEQLGLIDELTDIVMDVALHEFARMHGLADATLSVNVSATSLVDLALPDRIASSAAAAGVPMSRVMIEITESGLIKEFGKALDILARLRLRGAGISIDDFGTGYSSMAQLHRLPCTELKVDRMFVHEMLKDESAMAVVEESIGLAHRLKLKVVAEGVETAMVAMALGGTGCEMAQGYYFARPMPAADLVQWLARRPGSQPSHLATSGSIA